MTSTETRTLAVCSSIDIMNFLSGKIKNIIKKNSEYTFKTSPFDN